ncbi:hypothetical protein [Mycobacterium vicinigordonae]|nr:hypothetical protein [Mycobacterium vicinigordonae]
MDSTLRPELRDYNVDVLELLLAVGPTAPPSSVVRTSACRA